MGGSGRILDAWHLDVSVTITGGAGGVGDGINGAGGIGVNGARDKVTIVASGVISGGLNGDGVNRASAIAFAGGANRLELHETALIIGNVDARAGSNDTLAMRDGSASASDVSSIGDSAKYRGFETFEKRGTGSWKLTGTRFSGMGREQ